MISPRRPDRGEGRRTWLAGGQAETGFDLARPVGIEPRVRFAPREGGRTVGAGLVAEVTG